jgi:hypothetical protein
MFGQFNTPTEVELWNALIQAKQSYVQSLASLDALVFETEASPPLPMRRRMIEEAANSRGEAYVVYRQALDALTDSLRK